MRERHLRHVGLGTDKRAREGAGLFNRYSIVIPDVKKRKKKTGLGVIRRVVVARRTRLLRVRSVGNREEIQAPTEHSILGADF